MTENVDAKLISINPVLIPGKNKLYIYNCKNKKLQEYVTTSTSGFEISGTSIKNKPFYSNALKILSVVFLLALLQK